MYLIRTRLGKSLIEGIGLFAVESIKKDTPVWKMTSWDLLLDREDLESLPEAARNLVLCYGYYDIDEECYVLDVDNGRFTNHSDTPNLITPPDKHQDHLYAARDIESGEELTVNYRAFDGMVHNRKFRLGTTYRDFMEHIKT